jgi:uncharacterized DUF497 family protein
LQFEWDRRKATRNLRKHGVSFDEASSVFSDSFSLTGADPDHSIGVDNGDMMRIISARRMTKSERKLYEEG